MIKHLYWLVALLCIVSCKGDRLVSTESNKLEEIVTITKHSPRGLSPILFNKSFENNIQFNLFYKCVDLNPETLELEPVLLEQLPKLVENDSLKALDIYRWDIRFRNQAKWEDGSPVSADDFKFSLKLVKHPKINAPAYRTHMKPIVACEVDPNDRKKCSVYIKGSKQDLFSDLAVYPAYIYDKQGIMKSVDLSELMNNYSNLPNVANLDAFAVDFNGPKFTKETVVGAGPYILDDWQDNQYLILKKKANHWTDEVNLSGFKAMPNQIKYLIVASNAAALNLLKSDEIDVMSGLSYKEVEQLKSNEQYSNQYTIEHIKRPVVYFLALNTRRKELQEKPVRQALSKMLMVDTIIQQYEHGYGKRINSHFFFNDTSNDLPAIKYDLNSAEALLQQANWSDTNNDGTVDKTIDGSKVELELDLVSTGSNLGKLIANIFQQEASKLGVKINIVHVDRNRYSKQLSALDYDIALSAKSIPLKGYSPYRFFHTDNTGPKAGNITNFGNEYTDDLIESLSDLKSPKAINQVYRKLEKVLYDEQHVIYLYSPVEHIVYKSNLAGLISAKKPGFAVSSFYRKN